jgi:hypothetical protein
VRTQEASGLPTDGRRLFVQLSYRVSGALLYVDFSYVAPLREPAISSPLPGTVLNGPNITFVWAANGADVSSWRLVVGSVPNGGDYHDSGTLPATELSRGVTGLPTDGRNVYVRLEYVTGAETSFKNYAYISGVGLPEVVTPAPGTVLPGPNVTFSWTSNEAPVSTWIFSVGTSPGASNLYYSGYLSPAQTSASVQNLPTDSRTIHVRLRYLLTGAWQQTDYQFTAADLSPSMIAPPPGSVLPGASATFTWTSNGAPVTSWIVEIGTSPGATNVYYSGYLASGVTSANVSTLPTNGSRLYLRLRWVVSGAWQAKVFEYTASQ